jgi:hypothetical protein
MTNVETNVSERPNDGSQARSAWKGHVVNPCRRVRCDRQSLETKVSVRQCAIGLWLGDSTSRRTLRDGFTSPHSQALRAWLPSYGPSGTENLRRPKARGFGPGHGSTIVLALKARPNPLATVRLCFVVSARNNPSLAPWFIPFGIATPISVALSGRIRDDEPPRAKALGYSLLPLQGKNRTSFACNLPCWVDAKRRTPNAN